MPNQQLEDITQMLRARREEADPDISFAESRAMFEEMVALFPLPESVSSTPVDAGGIPGEWIAAQGASDEQTIYWLHGGGYCIGSINTHRGLLAGTSAASGARAFAIAWRRRTRFRPPSKTPLRGTAGCCQPASTRHRSS